MKSLSLTKEEFEQILRYGARGLLLVTPSMPVAIHSTEDELLAWHERQLSRYEYFVSAYPQVPDKELGYARELLISCTYGDEDDDECSDGEEPV